MWIINGLSTSSSVIGCCNVVPFSCYCLIVDQGNRHLTSELKINNCARAKFRLEASNSTSFH